MTTNLPTPHARLTYLRLPVLLLVLRLTGCGTPETPPEESAGPPAETPRETSADESVAPTAPPSVPPLTPDGWGSIRIGMTRAEVVAAAGEDANPNAVGGPEPDMCDQFRPRDAPPGLLVMVEQDRVTRISLSAGTGITTERGFGVGDPAAVIEEAYGSNAEISPHKYSPAPAEYITVWTTPPGDPDPRGIVYEVGPEGTVEHVHAGGPSIQYVEGCL